MTLGKSSSADSDGPAALFAELLTVDECCFKKLHGDNSVGRKV